MEWDSGDGARFIPKDRLCKSECHAKVNVCIASSPWIRQTAGSRCCSRGSKRARPRAIHFRGRRAPQAEAARAVLAREPLLLSSPFRRPRSQLKIYSAPNIVIAGRRPNLSSPDVQPSSPRLLQPPHAWSCSVITINTSIQFNGSHVANEQATLSIFVNENSAPFPLRRQNSFGAQERELTVDGISANIFAFANYFLSFLTVLCGKSISVTAKLRAYVFEGGKRSTGLS
jgi:hypothetical protein